MTTGDGLHGWDSEYRGLFLNLNNQYHHQTPNEFTILKDNTYDVLGE
jgi:hypothetical protein